MVSLNFSQNQTEDEAGVPTEEADDTPIPQVNII